MDKKYITERDNKFLKLLDKYIGIPLVFALGTLRKSREKPKLIEKIALLKTAAIGDTVLLSAIIDDIKEKLPDVKITFFTGSSNYEIAKIISEQYSNIDVVKLSIKNPLATISELNRHSFDVWLDFGSWPRINALFSYFANAKFKVGFKTKNQYRHYVYDVFVEHNSNIHEVFNYKNIIKQIGIEGNNLPQLKLNPNIKKKNNLVVVHIFPGGYKSYLKEWPEDYWIKIINYLTKNNNIVYITGAKSDRLRAEEIKNKCEYKDEVKVVAGRYNLKDTIKLLNESRLVISVNTGIMHIASALNCNLIALHGPTSSKRWGPLNKNSISIQSSLDCSPCLNLGFEYGCNENKCMINITPDIVIEAMRRFI